jgi:hypothetical protein
MMLDSTVKQARKKRSETVSGTITYVIDEDGTVTAHADLGDPAAEIAALTESASWFSADASEVLSEAQVKRRRDPYARSCWGFFRFLRQWAKTPRIVVGYAADPDRTLRLYRTLWSLAEEEA